MDLPLLETGHPRLIKLALPVMGLVAGTEPDDVVKLSLYRPDFFGREWIKLLRATMRGPSFWSTGQRQLIAAFASHLNACPCCLGIHSQTAASGLARTVAPAQLENWRTAGFDARIEAIFTLIERLQASTAPLRSTDLIAARAHGLTDDAIHDALQVWFLFDLINCLAHAFGFAVLDDGPRRRTAAVLHRTGYNLPGFLLRSRPMPAPRQGLRLRLVRYLSSLKLSPAGVMQVREPT